MPESSGPSISAAGACSHSISAVTGTVRAINADHEVRWRVTPFIRLAVIWTKAKGPSLRSG